MILGACQALLLYEIYFYKNKNGSLIQARRSEVRWSSICVYFLSPSLGPPVISTPPVDQFVINNGSNAVFTCGALAIPPHEVYWTFTNASGVTSPVISTMDGMNTTKYLINTVNGTVNFGTLTVTDVRYEDRGVYTCNATNEIGSDLANATLTVHG